MLFLLSNFYVIYKDGEFLLINTTTHESYVLTAEKMAILADEKKAVCDQDFIEAGIIGSLQDAQKSAAWPFAPISKLLSESLAIKEDEAEVLTGKEFWLNYLGECDQVLAQGYERRLPNCIRVFDLPIARDINFDFHQLLKSRRTIRQFENKAITQQQLADILYTTFGQFHENFGEKYLDIDNTISWRRSSPSAGGLHPIDAYVFIHNVDSLPVGLYFYDCRAHNLRLLKLRDYEKKFLEIFMGQYFYQNAAFHILTVANLEVVAAKYPHSRAFLFPYIENGHLIQTAWLTAVALGLKGWMTCAFCDQMFVDELGLKAHELPISVLSIGYGCDESLGPKIRKELEEIGYERDFVAMMAMQSMRKVQVKKSADKEGKK